MPKRSGLRVRLISSVWSAVPAGLPAGIAQKSQKILGVTKNY